MSGSELQGWLTLLLSSCVAAAGLIYCYFKLSAKAAKDVYEAEKKEVLRCIAAMAESMGDIKKIVREIQNDQSNLKLTVKELEIKFAFFNETMEKYYRSVVLNNGDGTFVDPRKANRQK